MTASSVGLLASEDRAAAQLSNVVQRAPHLMRALVAAREVGAPDWLISAGAIREVAWDGLHGRDLTAVPRDVDLGFFDPLDLSSAREHAVEALLRDRAPDLPWDVKNQAAVHLWYPKVFGDPVAPFECTAEAISTFPEIASCVGLRLLPDDDLLVVAPYGLEDLLGGVSRHNPRRVTAAFYAQRLEGKGWRERWPKVTYVAP